MSAQHHRAILRNIAYRAMQDRGLLPEFSAEALAELATLSAPAKADGSQVRDLRAMPWASVDNDDSLDLDPVTAAEAMPDGRVRILVAVADVDALVHDDTAIDAHARHNTTSVYTAARVFPMLPEKLSTDLTSLNPGDERLAVVTEMVIGEDGSLQESDIYRARVLNHAKLAYDSVAAWLDESGPMPDAIADTTGLGENLRLQERTAQRMGSLRHLHGALRLETIEATPVFAGEEIQSLQARKKNRATAIIEDFMIGANGVAARYLASRGYPSIRRVVREPRRWERIAELARDRGTKLPGDPDPIALNEFLASEQTHDPIRFPDLSLSVIKLLGPGEYVADAPGQSTPGHFGLAVKDYTHSTAPNRRYSDVITQRLLKAAIAGDPWPYTIDELEAIARRCTEAEDAANKVERQVGKSAAAILLEARIGERFQAIVTGAAPKGTWVRLLELPVEGKLVRGYEGSGVGDRMRVRLLAVDIERGYIDFGRVGRRQ